MAAGEIQQFTPLIEVLCGFNVAFVAWDGMAKLLTNDKARRAWARNTVLISRFAERSTPDLFERAIHEEEQLGVVQNRIIFLWKR